MLTKIIRLSFWRLSLFLLFLGILSPNISKAQGPGGGSFGFGLILGEPLGGTIKIWTSSKNAFVFDIGESYFGSPRLDGDYLWNFNAFRSRIVEFYAGLGLAVGFGEGDVILYKRGPHDFYVRNGTDIGLGARAIFGLDIVPERMPLEFFVEAGPLLGVSPGFGVGFDFALGVRFYP